MASARGGSVCPTCHDWETSCCTRLAAANAKIERLVAALRVADQALKEAHACADMGDEFALDYWRGEIQAILEGRDA